MNILIANVGNIRINEIKVLAEALNLKHKVSLVAMGMSSMNASHKGLAFSFSDMPVRVIPLLYKDLIKNTAWVGQRSISELEKPSKIAAKDKKEKESKALAAFDNISAYEFDSTPADAISVMLGEIMAHRKPDLVIVGINNGLHMGQDIYCSSSVGMAIESNFYGVPAIVVSIENKVGGHTEAELMNSVEFVVKNIERIARLKLPKHTFLNINVPTVDKYKELKGVKVAGMSRMTPLSTYVEKLDANGNRYYWANKASRSTADLTEECASTWFDKGFVTIVPISYDATDFDAINAWNSEHSAVYRLKTGGDAVGLLNRGVNA